MTDKVDKAAAAMNTSDWVPPLARAGFAARGIIYLLIGGLALLSALGRGGSTEGSQSALETLMHSRGGWILLLLIGLGLAGFAIWRVVQAAVDVDCHGKDAKGLFVRGGFLVSAATHVGLAIWAVARAIGYASSGGGNASTQQEWTAWLLGQPFGRTLIASVGGVILGVGVAHILKGWKTKFLKHLAITDKLAPKLIPVCRFGCVARGVAFVIIGGFFIYAGWTYDAEQAGGLKQAFDTVRGVAFGRILFGTLALGFVAFAIYNFVEARYRKINLPT